MKLEIDDMTQVAERRYYLRHRTECILAGAAFVAGAILLIIGLPLGGDCDDGMKWTWTHAAVALTALGGITLTATLAWAVWYTLRRTDWVRETVQRWVDEEGKEQKK